MSLSTDEFPTRLPLWIKRWAIACRDCDEQENGIDHELVAHEDLDSLWRLLSDVEVATSLEKLDSQGASNGDDHKIRIVKLLFETCYYYRRSKNLIVETPSVLTREISKVSNDAAALARHIKRHQDFLDTSLGMRYLSDRISAAEPSGFVSKGRSGLRKAKYSSEENDPKLTDYLTAFSEDLREELSDFPKRINSLEGGKDAPIRYQIRRLKSLYRHLFSRVNNAVVSHLLTAINGQDVAEERVKKTKVK